MAIERICVLGAGKLGSGIAHVAASSGFDVALRDVEKAKLEQALHRVEASQGGSEKPAGRITTTMLLEEAAKDAILNDRHRVLARDLKCALLQRKRPQGKLN